MKRALWALPIAGLVLAQLTNFGNMPIPQGSVTTQSQLEALMSTPGTLHILTPEATNWSFYLANLHQRVGQSYVYVTKPEARRLCSLANGNYAGNYAIVRVVPTEERPQPVAFILPPTDGDLKGILFEGEGIYREMVLLNLPDPLQAWYSVVGPKVGRAYVYGSPSAGDLRAQVYLRETVWVQDTYPSLIGSYSFASPWNATLQVNLGRGEETLWVQGYDPNTAYRGTDLRVADASGADVGYAVLNSEVVWVDTGIDYSRTARYNGTLYHNYYFDFDPGTGMETFRAVEYAATCYPIIGCPWRGYYIYDLDGRYRGSGQGSQCGLAWCTWADIHPRRREMRKERENVSLYARRWRQVTQEVYKGDFPVMPEGRVVVEGDTYSIPELAGYLASSSAQLRYAKDSPLISYLVRQMGLEEGSLVNNRLLAGVATPPERPKPLSAFCQNPR